MGEDKGNANANASAATDVNAENTEDENPQNMVILEAIRDLKTDFSGRFDGVLADN